MPGLESFCCASGCCHLWYQKNMSFGMLAASNLVPWVAHRVIQGNFGTQEGTPLGSGLRFLSILGECRRYEWISYINACTNSYMPHEFVAQPCSIEGFLSISSKPGKTLQMEDSPSTHQLPAHPTRTLFPVRSPPTHLPPPPPTPLPPPH